MTEMPETQPELNNAGKFLLAALLALVLNAAFIYAILNVNFGATFETGFFVLLMANAVAVTVYASKRQFAITAGIVFGLVCAAAAAVAYLAYLFSHMVIY